MHSWEFTRLDMLVNRHLPDAQKLGQLFDRNEFLHEAILVQTRCQKITGESHKKEETITNDNYLRIGKGPFYTASLNVAYLMDLLEIRQNFVTHRCQFWQHFIFSSNFLGESASSG